MSCICWHWPRKMVAYFYSFSQLIDVVPEGPLGTRRILWVDDNPENNTKVDRGDLLSHLYTLGNHQS